MSDPYQVLGTSKDADQAELKRAYHAAARKWHPDRQGNNSSARAEEEMRKLNEAWEILGDVKKRRRFDNATQIEGQLGVRIDPSHFTQAAKAQSQAEAQYKSESTKRRVFTSAPVLMMLGIGVVAIMFSSSLVTSDSEASREPEFELGTGIELGDCVNVMQGPSLLEVPCTENAGGVVIGARLENDDRDCVAGTTQPVTLLSGVVACLR